MFLRTRDTPTLSSLASVDGSAQLARLTVTENCRRRTIALQDLAPRPRLVPPASAGAGIDAFSSSGPCLRFGAADRPQTARFRVLASDRND
jgi:hypothetical protein